MSLTTLLRLSCGFALVALYSACATHTPARPFKNAQDVNKITAEEDRLWAQAGDFDEVLVNRDILYEDPRAEAYIQGVMDKLYPEFQGKISVKIVKTPILNAFALPNGSIYFHIGLLARLENEAQLASVLGHEGAHFVQKHSLQQSRNVKSAAAFALGAALAGIPLVGDVLALSSITGFSRDLEREADRLSYERMRRSGYDAAESVKVFEHLLAELKSLEIDEPYFFSSHPKLQERIDSFRELVAADPGRGGERGEQRFLQRTYDLRIACLRSDLSFNRYKSVILQLNNPNTRKRYPSYAYYYLGEAYRRRAETGDLDNAAYAYRQAVQAAPDFAPSYRALGLYHFKKKEYAKAKPWFEQYLQRAPQAKDAAYVREYLNQIHRGVR